MVFIFLTVSMVFASVIPVSSSELNTGMGARNFITYQEETGRSSDLGTSTRLIDLKPFGETRVQASLPSQTDNYGNKYTTVLSCNDGYGEYNEAEYNLSGNYGSFTGTFYITKASVDSAGGFESQKQEIPIYGDDELLCTKKGCTSKNKPEEFLVDLTGVEFLKVVFDGAYYNEGFGFKRPLIVIGEPILWENIVPGN